MYVDLKPKKFETYLGAKGFSRLVECCLLLWNNDSKSKKHKKEAEKVRQLYCAKAALHKHAYFHIGYVPVQKSVSTFSCTEAKT